MLSQEIVSFAAIVAGLLHVITVLSAAAVIMLGVAVMTRRANTGPDVIVSATPGQHRVNGLLRLKGEIPREIATIVSWAG